MAFLGDQVYADLTSEQMQEFIRARRDIDEPPGEELKDYEEYAHLYYLAWSDPANRWLLSTLPSAMIFDDHDIRDDWNTSLSWKKEMEATSWWHGRIVAGLASYWVYQHLGNLSPQERAEDADLAADRRPLGRGRDRRQRGAGQFRGPGRSGPGILPVELLPGFRGHPADRGGLPRRPEPGRRTTGHWWTKTEMAWLDGRMRGGFRHLLVATSLPFLLPMGLHYVESWNEAVSQGAWGKRAARVGEKLRQAVDLEHWGAFQNSFREVAAMAERGGRRQTRPGTGNRRLSSPGTSTTPTSAEVERTSGSRIMQAVCSPIRNPLPRLMRSFAAVMSYGLATPVGALVARSAKVPDPPFRWSGVKGPWFDNNLACLEVAPEGLKLWWQTGVVDGGDQLHPGLKLVSSVTVAPRRAEEPASGRP